MPQRVHVRLTFHRCGTRLKNAVDRKPIFTRIRRSCLLCPLTVMAAPAMHIHRTGSVDISWKQLGEQRPPPLSPARSPRYSGTPARASSRSPPRSTSPSRTPLERNPAYEPRPTASSTACVARFDLDPDADLEEKETLAAARATALTTARPAFSSASSTSSASPSLSSSYSLSARRDVSTASRPEVFAARSQGRALTVDFVAISADMKSYVDDIEKTQHELRGLQLSFVDFEAQLRQAADRERLIQTMYAEKMGGGGVGAEEQRQQQRLHAGRLGEESTPASSSPSLHVSSAEHWLDVEGMNRGDHVTSLRHEDTPLAGASSAAARRDDRRRQFEYGGRTDQGP